MDGRVVVLLAALASAAFSGCAADDTPSEDEKVQSQIESGEAVALPTWQVEQYWTYALSANGTEFAKSSFVVTSETATDYIVETNDPGVAYYDALWDITFLGEIRKSDLAGSQNGDRIAMFQWPLGADMTWTTTWDGMTLNMESSSMGPNQFHVMGHDDQDRMVLEYHYNGDVQWFEYMVFYDVESGDEAFRLDLDGNGDDFSGTIYRYQIQDPVVIGVSPSSTTLVEHEWGDANEVQLTVSADCNGDAAGQVLIGVGPANGTFPNRPPYAPFVNEPDEGMILDCASADHDAYTVVKAVHDDAWAIDMMSASASGTGEVVLEPRIVETLAL